MQNKIRGKVLSECPLCHDSHIRVYIKDATDTIYHVEGEWDICQCESCGLKFLNPMPLKEDIGLAYAEYYTHSEEKANFLSFLRPLESSYINVKYHYGKRSFTDYLKFAFVCLFPTERAEMDMRFFYLDARNQGRLLDVGCGSGELLRRLSVRGWVVQGIDFDENAIQQCRRLGVEASVGDLFSERYPAGSFDVVTLNHVIEHLYDTEDVIRECYRILRPGGRLVMATPNGENIWLGKFRKNWFCLQSPAHLQIFSCKNLNGVCKKVGFEILKSTTTSRNGHWVYACSSLIKRHGRFDFGKQKPSKILLLKGKLAQLLLSLGLVFNHRIGTEVVVIAQKPLKK